MHPDIERRVARVAADRDSGASEILDAVVAILRDALVSGDDIVDVARAVCRAQPTMASVWNAGLMAIAASRGGAPFERFIERISRAPRSLARFAGEAFDGTSPLSVVTISFSRSVETVLRAANDVRTVRVACSESRPALEGRRLAMRLAEHGIAVTCFSDAGIGHALGEADAVIVGADAIAPEWFLNKIGTRMLAAAAAQQGVPVYVVATRDKFASALLAAALCVREGEAAEVWDRAPAGVTVRNPYFESIPLELITTVISDIGLLGAGMICDVCQSRIVPAALVELLS